MRRAAMVGTVAGAALWVWASRRFDTVAVRGSSMEPTLRGGDRLLVTRATPRVGDVVLARDPRDRRRELVKRVTRIDARGTWLEGDNVDHSTDARTFGAVEGPDVAWRVIARYWPPGRARLIR